MDLASALDLQFTASLRSFRQAPSLKWPGLRLQELALDVCKVGLGQKREICFAQPDLVSDLVLQHCLRGNVLDGLVRSDNVVV